MTIAWRCVRGIGLHRRGGPCGIMRRRICGAQLLDLLALDDAGFKRRFAGTPILRTKRRGLLRNVCVALGNVGDETALAPLEKAAADPEPIIAEHASWALGQIRRRLLKAA